jgi:endonuclease/exonuclease/phosphatase family metal-dependent hydrolase
MSRALAPTLRRRFTLLWAALIVIGALVSAGGFSTTADAAVKRKVARIAKSETDFRVASFNILGYDHTRNGKRGMRDGRTRMDDALRFLDMRTVDVVGFQEFQPEQRERFMQRTGTSWGHYPGFELPRPAVHNSIAWRTSVWTLVDAHSIDIPYFRGKLIKMPVILLKHQETGREVWFGNFHNPANSKGNAERYRDDAMRRQIELANALDETGTPAIFTGDFNEREDFFCGFTRGTRWKAANGGSFGNATKCVMPPRETKPGIDWIFGSPTTAFYNYKRHEGRLVKRTTSTPAPPARSTTSSRARAPRPGPRGVPGMHGVVMEWWWRA